MGSQPTKANQNVQQQEKDNEKQEEIEILNYEDFVIVWYDEDPIDSRLESLNTVTASFTDQQQCFAYIKSIRNEIIFLVIGRVRLARQFQLLKRECQQIESIYVLCLRQPEDRQAWKDTKLFNDFDSLLIELEHDLQVSKNELVQMRPIQQRDDLDFVWHFLFFDLLFRIESQKAPEKELFFNELKLFYENNADELKYLLAFQRNYQSTKAFWWLTRQHTFLNQTLNKACRVKDYQFLSKFRFYLKDLYFDMNRLQKQVEITNHPLIVYRSQHINLKQIHKLALGNLIVVQTFLFTTVDCPRTDGTIIEIHIQHLTSHPFASMNEKGDFVFYPMTVFRLQQIRSKSLVFVLDQQVDEQVQTLIQNSIDKYSLEPENPIKMGLTLWKLNIGNIKQRYSYHLMLIESIHPKNCLDLANIHNNLAGILKENGSYRRAIQHYEIAEKLYLKSVKYNHLFVSPTYINLGNIYRLKRKYDQALKYHLKALEIREKSLDENDLQLAESLVEVALTYHEMGLNISSIPLLERTKNIYLNNQIPTNHPKFIRLQQALDVCLK